MTIKKFQGKTEAEATERAYAEFGAQTVIMNVKEIRPKGLFRYFKESTYEVTAAVEEAEPEPALPRTAVPKTPGKIDVAADEKISIERTQPLKEVFATVENAWSSSKDAQPAIERAKKTERTTDQHLEEKIESLQTLLEEKLAPQQPPKEPLTEEEPADENLKFKKMVYQILLENEVEERYANQIIDEVDNVIKGGASMDLMLSNIYQKMVLKFGQPKTIDLTGKKPKVVFFIGPTGVGKTTTIAKIASRFKLEKGRKVTLFTADTYRIAAVEQLRTYANILDTGITIIYSPQELNEKLEEAKDSDLILVDTAGFSHKNKEQLEETKELVGQVPGKYDKEVYLVLSATTKYKDLVDIADVYKENFKFKMIFTKMDETGCYGSILNMKLYTGAELSYSTYGQNVPEDIEVFNTQKIVKLLLGGK